MGRRCKSRAMTAHLRPRRGFVWLPSRWYSAGSGERECEPPGGVQPCDFGLKLLPFLLAETCASADLLRCNHLLGTRVDSRAIRELDVLAPSADRSSALVTTASGSSSPAAPAGRFTTPEQGLSTDHWEERSRCPCCQAWESRSPLHRCEPCTCPDPRGVGCSYGQHCGSGACLLLCLVTEYTHCGDQ